MHRIGPVISTYPSKWNQVEGQVNKLKNHSKDDDREGPCFPAFLSKKWVGCEFKIHLFSPKVVKKPHHSGKYAH